MSDYKKITKCLVCENNDLYEVIDLGFQPLVNNLKYSTDEIEMKGKIVVNECYNCSHRQLSIAIDQKLLFSEYLYQTGTSQTHLDFFKNFADRIGVPKCWNRILDIGCNDGSMLKFFKDLGWQAYGVEPATRLAAEAVTKGLHITCDFFPTTHAFNEKFHCITAFNVFAHNDDPKEFLKSMVDLLHDNGAIYILTTPAALDNYYHEHISYFTPKSMAYLADECDLDLERVEKVSMHGGSHLFKLVKQKQEPMPNPVLKDLGIFHNPVVGYGAAAGGIVLLNYLNLHPEYVIDDNELKQGKFIPGVNVPIFSNEKLFNDERDLTIIILAHHLAAEIMEKIKSHRNNKNDTFIHPIEGVI